jgi:hypothetical protein
MAVAWPAAIHEGNGKAAVFFDSSMSQEQVDAMVGIMTNEYGGLPHEILAGTITEILGPYVEPIQISVNGTKSSITIGDKVHAEMTPHVSPVDVSEEQEVHIVLPKGFIWQDAQAARAIKQTVNVDGLEFEEADTNAFYSVVEHSN